MGFWRTIWKFLLGILVAAVGFFLLTKRKSAEFADELATIEKSMEEMKKPVMDEAIERQVKRRYKERLDEIKKELEHMPPDKHIRDLMSDVDRVLGELS